MNVESMLKSIIATGKTTSNKAVKNTRDTQRLKKQKGLRRAVAKSVEHGKQAPKAEKRLSVGGKQKEKRKEIVKCALHSPRLQVEFEKDSDVKPYARGFTTIDRK